METVKLMPRTTIPAATIHTVQSLSVIHPTFSVLMMCYALSTRCVTSAWMHWMLLKRVARMHDSWVHCIEDCSLTHQIVQCIVEFISMAWLSQISDGFNHYRPTSNCQQSTWTACLLTPYRISSSHIPTSDHKLKRPGNEAVQYMWPK